MSLLRYGVLGCGDFLRWNEPVIRASRDAAITAVYDPDEARATTWATKLGARRASSAQDLIGSAEVDAVALFVPPWARRELLIAAVDAGKHILTTKPLAPNVADCTAMAEAVARRGVRCGVIYNRTGSAIIETLSDVFARGDLGRLALYKHDWIHPYPRWNAWATDPVRNGGPFQDAMIHNLNAARYLMARPVVGATFFADRHSQDLACADTETMKVDFADGRSAHLFITWAADLETFGTAGNDREHHDLFWLVTDQGWRITIEGEELVASRRGERRRIPLRAPETTVYDGFARAVAGGAWPRDLPDLADATADIALIRAGMATPGVRLAPGAGTAEPPIRRTPAMTQRLRLPALLMMIPSLLPAVDSVWIEGENPSSGGDGLSSTHVFLSPDPALSGGKSLGGTGHAGLTIEYAVEAPSAGTYNAFVRRFWNHGPFRWRVGDGEWRELREGTLLETLPVGQHCISWLPMGAIELAKGKQTLRIEALGDGPFVIDCFAFVKGPFDPTGTLKPGEKCGKAEPGTWAFEPDADTFAVDPLNLRALNEPVAGAHGRIAVDATGDFVDGAGKPIRFGR